MAARIIEEPGTRYGRLVVVSRAENGPKGDTWWLCQCDCGVRKAVAGYRLRNGWTVSCGCFRSELTGDRHRTHGGSKGMPEYQVWKTMRQRCSKPYSSGYYLYGERGITVCKEWSSFARFIADMGTRPSPQHSIDRIDNSGPYCKENCRWATRLEQARNKRNNVQLTFEGRTQSMPAWAEELGLTYSTLKSRRKHGWDVERMLSAPRLEKRSVKI